VRNTLHNYLPERHVPAIFPMRPGLPEVADLACENPVQGKSGDSANPGIDKYFLP